MPQVRRCPAAPGAGRLTPSFRHLTWGTYASSPAARAAERLSLCAPGSGCRVGPRGSRGSRARPHGGHHRAPGAPWAHRRAPWRPADGRTARPELPARDRERRTDPPRGGLAQARPWPAGPRPRPACRLLAHRGGGSGRDLGRLRHCPVDRCRSHEERRGHRVHLLGQHRAALEHGADRADVLRDVEQRARLLQRRVVRAGHRHG